MLARAIASESAKFHLGSGQFTHSAMARPMIHSNSIGVNDFISSVNNVTTCL
jgi:hypothetical protein